MKHKLTNILLIAIFILISNSSAVTLTQKLGDEYISQEIEPGETVTLSFTNQPSYTFDSWVVESGNVSIDTSNSVVEFVMPDEDVIINANYIVTPTEYTVTFDAAGGTCSPTSKQVIYGAEYGELPEPTRAGYAFAGWYLDKTYIASASMVTVAKNHTIEAKWSKTVSIIYDENTTDAVTNMPSPNPQSGSINLSDTSVALTISNATPIRAGYTFKGWSTSDAATQANYSANGKIILTESVTLYAIWEGQAVTVTFDPNGGNVSYPTRQVKYLEKYGDLPVAYYTASGTIGNFKGWYTKQENYTESDKVTPDTIVNTTSNHTLYAQYEMSAAAGPGGATASYIVEHYVKNETTGEYSETPYKTEEKMGLLMTPMILKSNQIAIEGMECAYGSVDDVVLDSILLAEDGSTIIKLYYQNARYRLTLVNDTQTMIVASDYNRTINIDVKPIKNGHIWNGWTSSDTSLIPNLPAQTTSIKMPKGNVTLTAQFIEASTPQYRIEHYLENSTDANYTLYKAETRYGLEDSEIIVSDLVLNDEDLKYSSFTEATVDGTVVTKTNILADGSLVIKLYYERKSYTLTIVRPSGTTTSTHKWNEDINIEAGTIEDGYTWNGWKSSNIRLLASQSQQNITITMPKGNITLTAQLVLATAPQYTVEHYLENIANADYTLYKSETKNGEAGTEIIPETLVIGDDDLAHSTFKEAKVNNTVTTSTNVAADGSLVIKMYYQRNKYTLKLINDSEVTEIPYKWGKSIDINVSAVNSEYTWNYWESSDPSAIINLAEQSATITMPKKDMTLTANWNTEPPIAGGTSSTITLTYNSTLGNGTPESRTKTVASGNIAQFVVSSIVPTLSGFNFLGWSTDSAAATGEYKAGDIISISSNTTLYAIWGRTATQITLTYDANNGTGAPSAESKTVTTINASFTISTTTPTRTGYTFKGWSTSSSATTASYSAGGTIVVDNNTTLYAVWEQIKVTVTLDNQNPTTAGSTSVSATYGAAMPAITTPAKTYTITYNHNYTGSANTTVTANCIFGGYYTETNGGGTQYYTDTGASAKTWDKTAATTLYAKWTNGSITLATPTRTGYTFNGWYSEAACTNLVGAGGASYTATSAVTLYAKWTKNTYTLTVTQGTGGTISPGTTTVDQGGSQTFTATPSSGYSMGAIKVDGTAIIKTSTFATDSTFTVAGSGSYPWVKSGSSFISNNKNNHNTTSTSTIKLSGTGTLSFDYSVSSESSYDKLTITVADSTGTKTAVNAISGEQSGSYSQAISGSTTITLSYAKDGSSNTGSDIGSISNLKFNPTSYTFSNVTANHTITATYTHPVTLTYNANGGSSAPASQTQAVTAGSSKSFTISSSTPYRSGYTFKGWSKSSSATSASYSAGGSISISSDTTLYAVWYIEVDTCNCSYCDNETDGSDLCGYCPSWDCDSNYCYRHESDPCGSCPTCRCCDGDYSSCDCSIIYCDDCGGTWYCTEHESACSSCDSCYEHCSC